MSKMTEDMLVQQTASDYIRDKLGWDAVYAYNEETFGIYGTLGRKNDNEVVLTRYLKAALVKFNPDLPQQVYEDAVRQCSFLPLGLAERFGRRLGAMGGRNRALPQYRDEKG